MMRTVGATAILLAFVAWLLFSYWTAGAALLPTIAFGGAWSATWMPFLTMITFVVCAGVQLWLVYATVQSLRKPAGPAEAAALRQFRLKLGVETLWTAAPLFITVALAAWILIGAG
jgi:hypothetical protein